ncbi:hypothetical protein [Pseudonocardia sp. ICBG601]|uniref:hypothetical protein n=1 Tax=Pseudonocardia sp. ICBG601 TaxID=2846759 RepID=UPI001CF62346|nr:hypothetical protein [Pseudonocardia sp. ICBG601]
MLALDGKTLRGARVRAADGRVWLPHLVSVLDQTSGGVLGQVQVAEKGSEITAFTALLDPSTSTMYWSPRTLCTPSEPTPTTYTAAAGTT